MQNLEMSKIQAQYAALCQEIGHLQNNKRKIDALLKKLEAQCDSLDMLVESLKSGGSGESQETKP